MMQAATMTPETSTFKDLLVKRAPFLVSIALAIVIADQWTKYLAVKHLTHSFAEQTDWQRFVSGNHPVPRNGVVVVDGMWDFTYVENPGAAWGLLSRANEKFRAPFFIVVSIVASFLILNYYVRSPEALKMRRWALALVFGGAIGNFIDRIRLGYVIDFIDWHWFDKATWPTFNIADAGISIGVAMMIAEMLFKKPQPKGV